MLSTLRPLWMLSTLSHFLTTGQKMLFVFVFLVSPMVVDSCYLSLVNYAHLFGCSLRSAPPPHSEKRVCFTHRASFTVIYLMGSPAQS